MVIGIYYENNKKNKQIKTTYLFPASVFVVFHNDFGEKVAFFNLDDFYDHFARSRHDAVIYFRTENIFVPSLLPYGLSWRAHFPHDAAALRRNARAQFTNFRPNSYHKKKKFFSDNVTGSLIYLAISLFWWCIQLFVFPLYFNVAQTDYCSLISRSGYI